MDTSQLTMLARDTVTAIAPLVAGGALARIGEATTDATITAFQGLWKLMSTRFHGDRKAMQRLQSSRTSRRIRATSSGCRNS
ncbi:hypothetical protein HC891_15895 [Candidatus Gracilibacteria bacterium]|nr:hypothetical protein [Candidatus Gracilibacteria bacterium]